jgi:hypothetical protein
MPAAITNADIVRAYDRYKEHLDTTQNEVKAFTIAVQELLMGRTPQHQYGSPRYYEILEEMAELHERKARDYSGDREPFANFRDSVKLGVEPWRGVLVRILDKWNRIESLLGQGGTGMVKDETIIDTSRDMSAYLLIFEILYSESVSGGLGSEDQNNADAISGSEQRDGLSGPWTGDRDRIGRARLGDLAAPS